jgi:hypothetical protein
MAPPPLRTNALQGALQKISLQLDTHRWAVVGGIAVGVRAVPRTTADVDVSVSVADDAEAEALVHRLVSGGYEVLAVLEQNVTGRLATFRLRSPGPTGREVVTDVLFASCGIEPEVCAAAEPIEILPGLVVPVATIAHLMAMKTLSRDRKRRARDYGDFYAMLDRASEADLDSARAALRLIKERGYHRGRQLVEEFDELVIDRG